jgi:hypothetical protein
VHFISGPITLHIYASLAEQERKMISEGTTAGLVRSRKRLGMAARSKACQRRITWLISAFLIAACTHDSSPELNSKPTSVISIVGTVPTGVEIQLTSVWETTVVNNACAPKMSWPVRTRFPKQARFPITLRRRSGSEAVWETWWDLLSPGRCGWRLAALEFKADRSAAEFAAHAADIAASRMAFVCLDGCVANSAVANTDPSQLVTRYCKFSVLGKSDLAQNPCVYGSDGRLADHSAIPFKEQHILQSGQQLVRFVLVDLEQ